MSNEQKTLHPVAQRLKLFRNTICISLAGLYEITGISNATLSRMERGFSHNSTNVEILSAAFGISELDFRNEKVTVPKRSKLIQNLKEYAQRNNRDVQIEALLEGKHTAHFLDLYIEQGNLDVYQSIKEICIGIKEEFDIDLIGSDISNLLKKRIELGKIEAREGIKKRTFEYRCAKK